VTQLRRVSVTVPLRRAEEARATMIELFPEGFEERDGDGGVELAAYTDAGGEERIWHIFGAANAADVEAGWEDRWRSFHRPVTIGRLWVGPPWEEPAALLLPVVIDPGRAFGTGGHPTTQLCLAFLQELERGSVLDVGCGSGVLSIAAAKLGFAPVIGLDFDPQAIEATRRNAEANGVEVEARLADATSPQPLSALDVTVANISSTALEQVGPWLRSRRVVASGYLLPDEPMPPGYRRLERRGELGWAADLFVRDD
jgi:ribosomal protein L11 methyltransferase